MDELLKGKSAIVTGGGRGIGLGIALCLARDGAEVAIGDIIGQSAEAAAREVRELGRRAIAVEGDVGTRAGAKALVDAALRAFDKVDILVNNAGVVGAPGWQGRPWPSDQDWAEVLRVNLMSRVYCSEAVMEHMKERRYGKIINIASIGGLQGSTAIPHYCASKAADINYTQSLALMLAPFSINVNAILPGILFTDMVKGIFEQGRRRDAARAAVPTEQIFRESETRVPLGRGQTPEDIGDMAAFLASDLARNITAQAIDVDGGMRMH
jgi:meso-butanediol dehydrogenase/(S,S)-butanediol dehydrogenase/diacetyl reductase